MLPLLEAGVFNGGLDGVPYTAASLELALNAMPVGISWARLQDRSILFTNRCFHELFGYQRGEFADVNDWIEKTYPFAEDRALVAEKWGPGFETKHDRETSIEPIELRILCKDGTVKTILNSGVILPGPGWALATFVDITERKRNELLFEEVQRQAHENESIYRLLLDHSPGMIILAPFDKSKRYVSPAVEQLTGFTAQEYLAMRHPGMIHPDDQEAAKRVVEQIRAGNLSQVFRYRTLQARGGYRWVEATITGYLNPSTQQAGGYIATVRDISQQKIREDNLASENRQLSEVALLDELTGIPNRRTFNQTLASEGLRQSRSSTSDLSLLLLDVDYFKQFNDLYGHLPGDECLRKIAATLKCNLRRSADLAARFGGEEFVALLPMTDAVGAAVTARTILQRIAALNIPHAGSPYGIVTASIGVATWGAGTPLDQMDLIERADRALYQAKKSGRNRVFSLDTSPDTSPDPSA